VVPLKEMPPGSEVAIAQVGPSLNNGPGGLTPGV
jgi:hypothetical protein